MVVVAGGDAGADLGAAHDGVEQGSSRTEHGGAIRSNVRLDISGANGRVLLGAARMLSQL